MHMDDRYSNGTCTAAAAIVRCQDVKCCGVCVQEQTFASPAVKVEPSKTACAWPTSFIGRPKDTPSIYL
jgi:hypothetical protein